MQIKCKKQRARVQDKISTERIGRDFLEISIYEFTYSRYGFLFANKSKCKTQKPLTNYWAWIKHLFKRVKHLIESYKLLHINYIRSGRLERNGKLTKRPNQKTFQYMYTCSKKNKSRY